MKINKPTLQNTKPLAILAVILLSMTAGFFGGWAGSKQQASNPSTDEARQIVTTESQLISDIAKKVGPSVVSINVTSQQTATDFFGQNRSYATQAAGTGVILSKDGIIVTNRHVVGDATDVSVVLSDGKEFKSVEVIGKTSSSDPLDIAFLRIKDTEGHELTPAMLGDSGTVQVGDKAVAIGNALGEFQNTVTSGIISGFGRNVKAGDSSGSQSESLQNLIQTDAAINQGNSGGPLVNANAEVIGINTAIAGDGAENIGFAIPVNDIKGLVKSVLEKGKLERPYLGIRYLSLNDDTAENYGLDTKRGAYIVPGEDRTTVIMKDSPADKAGLKPGDIITKIEGTPIDENSSLTSLVAQHSVGEEIELTIVRNNQEQTVKVTLQAAPTN